jgi:hypothetical protein
MATSVPDAVKRLVDRFDQNRDAYLSGSYNEAQLRHEFLDPQLGVLDWGVANDTEPLETSRQTHIADAAMLSNRHI